MVSVASTIFERLNDRLQISKPRHPLSGLVLILGIAAWTAVTILVAIYGPSHSS